MREIIIADDRGLNSNTLRWHSVSFLFWQSKALDIHLLKLNAASFAFLILDKWSEEDVRFYVLSALTKEDIDSVLPKQEQQAAYSWRQKLTVCGA